MRRGDIYFVELGPTRGRELDTKRRPVLILSNNLVNSLPLVITVVPGTSMKHEREPFSTEFRVDPSPENGLTTPTLFQCIQLKALDHSRFSESPIGSLSEADLLAIGEIVKECLGLD
jgi:mRNA interferase MazF